MATLLLIGRIVERYIHNEFIKWRYNERDGVPSHRRLDWLLNRLFRHKSKKTPKLRVTGFVRGIHRWPVNSPHKGPVKRKSFHLMTSSCVRQSCTPGCCKCKQKTCFPQCLTHKPTYVWTVCHRWLSGTPLLTIAWWAFKQTHVLWTLKHRVYTFTSQSNH